jgi:hypothetical protein
MKTFIIIILSVLTCVLGGDLARATGAVLLPDLVPVSVGSATNRITFVASYPQMSPTLSVVYSITNEGPGAASGYWADVASVSTNGMTSGIIDSAYFYENWYPPGLSPGGSYTVTNEVPLPPQSGTYWLVIEADAFDGLGESSATNNTLIGSTPVTVSYEVVPPDLAPVSVAAVTNQVVFYPPGPQAPSVAVACVVTNEGLGAAVGYWYDVISISTNATTNGIISSQGFWQYYWNLPGVPAGGMYAETNVVSLPQQSGTYWLIYQANVYGELYEPDTNNNTLVASVPVTVSYQVVPPDLAPVSVKAATKVTFDPPSPQAPTVQVTCVVTNKGRGAALGGWYDMISISTDATTNGIIDSQEFWQDQNYQGLVPGGVYEETDTVSLPQQSGRYWLIFQANAGNWLYEPNTSNNTMIASAPVQVSYQVIPPDLAPVRVTAASNQITFHPPGPQPPTVSVTCVVANKGRGAAVGDWYDMISISTNATTNGIIASQEFWQDEEAPGVSAGGTYDETNVVSLPEQSGKYWLIFQANADGYLYEADTTNNTLIASVPVTVSYEVVPPDLAPVSVAALSNNVTFDPPSPQQPTVPVLCVVTNEGLGAATGSWFDMISISSDGTTNGIINSEYFWQLPNMPGVPAGGMYAETNYVTLPEQGGAYWLIFQANVGGNLYESDLTNNTLVASVPVTVSYQVVPPDLAPVNVSFLSNSVTFDPPGPQSASVPVVCLVTNGGAGAAIGDWYDAISVSTNGTLGGIISSENIWQYWYPGLPPGGAYQQTNYVSLPGQSGTYWVIYQANAYDQLYEADTTNNTLVASVPVTLSYQVVPPDLAPVSVTAASNQVDLVTASPQAPSVAVTCLVTNEGLGAAIGSWYDVISISTNATTNGIIDSQEFFEFWFGSSPLPSGGSYVETVDVSLPEQSGTYWLIFQANGSGGIYEADLTNNTLVAPVPVTVSYQVVPPDLAPVSIAAASNHVVFDPTSPQSPTIPVTCVITNVGLGAAVGGWDDMISISTNGGASGIISSQDFWQYPYSPGVSSGGTYAETNYVSLPEQSGTYWLIFQANADGYLYEAGTTNNTMFDPTPVTVAYRVVPPDLAPLSVVAASHQVVFDPPSPQAPTVSVVCLVTNKGLGAAVGGWYDTVSISTINGVTPNSVVSVQTFSASPPAIGLLPAKSYRETNQVTLPEQSGTYWLVFQANAEGNLYETNLANNVIVGSVPIKLSYQVVPPDLVPLSVAAASNHVAFSAASPQAQPTVPVVWAVMNQGLGAASGYWSDTVLVSTNDTTNGVISSQGVFVFWSPVPLAPNGVYQETNDITLPEQSGTYWLFLQVNNDNYLYEASVTNNTLMAPLPVTVTTQLMPPDLAPVGVASLSNNVAFYPSSPGASPTVPVVYAVTNLGPGTAFGYWYDTVSVSTNGTADGIVASEDFDEDWESPGLPPGGAYQRTNTVTLPAQSGTYWLIVQANDYNFLYEADTTNNTLTSSTPVSVTLYAVTPPDLAPVSLVPLTTNLAYYPPEFWSPPQPAIQVVYTVTNLGPGTAMGGWDDTVWVSTNSTADGIVRYQDFNEYWDPPGLPPGGTYQRTNTVTLPAQSGTYWLIFQANDYGFLYETDTNNNTLTSSVPISLTVYPATPTDLAPVKLAALTNRVVFHAPNPQSPPSVPVVYAVTNEGGTAFGSWVDVVSISTNASLSGIVTSQNFYESWTSPDLPPGGTYQRTNEVTLPTQSGKYWLIFQADAFNYGWPGVTDMTNNTLISSAPVTLTYTVQPPDLAPVSVEPLTTKLSYHPLLPESPAVAVRCVVKNKGTGAASGAWYDCVYVSTNMTINGAISSQLFQEQWTDPALAPGGEYQATNYVWLPQRSGKYWLIFQANDDAQLYEPNRANNTMAALTPVTLTYGLLAVPGRVTGISLAANFAVSSTSSTMVWKWSPVANASGYQVVLNEYLNGAWQAAVTNQTLAPGYAFTGLTPGARCNLLISAINAAGAGQSSTSSAIAALPPLPAPSVRALTPASVVLQIVPVLVTNYPVGGSYVSGGLPDNLPANHPSRSAAPLVSSADSTAGYRAVQGVQLQVRELPAYQYVVLSATDLTANAAWVPIATNTAAEEGTWFFTDTNNFNQAAHYYRVRVSVP